MEWTTTDSELFEPTDEDIAVAGWNTEQLERLGIPGGLARNFTEVVDWHDVAHLVECGCPPELALEIAR
jgi:hypothetical protein